MQACLQPKYAVFRADASPAIGGGHIVRCAALADALSSFGWQCEFVSQKGSAAIVKNLVELRHPMAEPVFDDTSILRRLADASKIDLLVIDHYGLDENFETAARDYAKAIMVIDDLPTRRHDCDILLDQTLDRSAVHYNPVLRRNHTVCLMGPDFALLRHKFSEWRERSLQRQRHAIDRVLISFGATDAPGLSAMAARAAFQAGVRSIDIAVGTSCPHIAKLRQLEAELPGAILHVDADMAPLMTSADLSIGAAGGTSWERCCLGLPSLLMVVADNQQDIAQALAGAGAARLIESSGSNVWTNLVKELKELQTNPVELGEMRRLAAAVCDGLGANRVAKQIDKLCTSRWSKE